MNQRFADDADGFVQQEQQCVGLDEAAVTFQAIKAGKEEVHHQPLEQGCDLDEEVQHRRIGSASTHRGAFGCRSGAVALSCPWCMRFLRRAVRQGVFSVGRGLLAKVKGSWGLSLAGVCADAKTISFFHETGHSNMSRVAILMATYNGERFLPAQLASIAAQTHAEWKLWASDDGSTDDTLSQLQTFSTKYPVSILNGPGQGFAANFQHLLHHPAVDGDYISFCDQDDVWHADKLTRAIAWLQRVPAEVPALYGSRANYIDEQGNALGASTPFEAALQFPNALVQSFAGGNTLVMNRAAHQLLQRAGKVPIASHDWWSYQLISGAGGRVMYDANPSLDYRQHAANIAGSNRGIVRSALRVVRLFQGHFRAWNDIQCEALLQNQSLLTEENQYILSRYSVARKSPLPQRLIGLYLSGIYRQTRMGNLGILTAALLKRI